MSSHPPFAPVADDPAATPVSAAEPALESAPAADAASGAEGAPDTATAVEFTSTSNPVPTRDCAAELRQRFPALFGGGYKPLKLRIQADIQQRAPGVFTRQALSAFLHRHTGSTGYLVAMTRSAHRYDLDGQPAGELSDEHRQAAVTELARRRAAHQAKVEQAEEGRRSRAALLRDFEQTTLTPANFCVLKGIAPQALDALLATARQEGQEQRARQATAALAVPQSPLPTRPPRQERRPDRPRRPPRAGERQGG